MARVSIPTGRLLTVEQFTAETGEKPAAKLEWFMRGEQIYHREGSHWYAYPMRETP